MKNHFIYVSAASVFFLFSCGNSSETKQTTTSDASIEAESPTIKAPEINIDGASWAASDLSTASEMIPVMLNLPKEAKTEQNGNGGVDVKLNEAYTITIAAVAVSSIKEAIESDKSLTINNTSYKNGKIISEEPNGFVYSVQMKDEENGTKYEPEAHFAYYLERNGAIYSILDTRPMDNSFLPGSTYTEENAKKLYDLVKTSAKLK